MAELPELTETVTLTDDDLLYVVDGANSRRITWVNVKGQIDSAPNLTLTDNTISVSKLETGTDGELITWDAYGNPATVPVGTVGQVLTSNGAGAAPTMQTKRFLNPLGAWSVSTTYAIDDVVTNNGSSYIATAISLAVQPGVTGGWESSWDVLAAKGADGVGAGDLVAANNLSDLDNAATARTNLDLGNVNNTADADKPISTAAAAKNTSQDGLISTNAANIATNTADIATNVAAIALNTAKNTYPSADAAKVAHLTVTGPINLDNIEAGATADQSDAEIETAYNSQVAQVSGAEKTAGTSTAIRRYAPQDIHDMIDTHAPAGGGGWQFIEKITTDGTENAMISADLSSYSSIRIFVSGQPDVSDQLNFRVGTSGPTWLTGQEYAYWRQNNNYTYNGVGVVGADPADATQGHSDPGGWISLNVGAFPVDADTARSGITFEMILTNFNRTAGMRNLIVRNMLYTASVSALVGNEHDLIGVITNSGTALAHVQFYWNGASTDWRSHSYIIIEGIT